MARRPNIILLTIDTLRLDRLGCYGNPRGLTPHLDRLAARGVRFTQAITGGSWTQAAFPVIMTSTYASMYGGCLGALAEERPSPITTLTTQGYRTAGFSTSPLLSRAYGYHRGFEAFLDLIPQEKDPLLRRLKGGQRLLRNPLTHQISNLLGQPSRPAKLYDSAAELTDAVCDWLDETGQPFFLWAHYMDVHWPYHLEETLTDPSEVAQAWRDLSHLHDANWNGAAVTADQRDHYIGLYETALKYTDAQIGRLLDYLEQKNLLDDTVIIALADHGEEFLEHGRWGHWEDNLYDEILRVPLLIALPDPPVKPVVARQVRTLDVMPTILELAGCTTLEALLGESMLPLWTGREQIYQNTVSVSEMWRDHWHIIAVRTPQFKYVWDSKRPNQPRLFDLQNDPKERQDVNAQYPEVVQQLHPHVAERLQQMENTKPEKAAKQPQLDEAVVQRLRGLGYVE